MLLRALSVLLWLIPVAWIVFGWWSWRTVRRNELRTAPLLLRPFPVLGMGIGGLGMWLYVAITQSLAAVNGAALGDAVRLGRFWREIGMALVIGYPIWLWGDFLFRRGLGWFLGMEARRPVPPPSGSDA